MPAKPPLLVHLIAAARPNFMKVAPLYHALKKDNDFEVALVHTGQHYDANMSADFFDDLGLSSPDYHLGVGSGSHAEQTGRVMLEFEKVCLRENPDLVIVVGDVNSTMACTITAKPIMKFLFRGFNFPRRLVMCSFRSDVPKRPRLGIHPITSVPEACPNPCSVPSLGGKPK